MKIQIGYITVESVDGLFKSATYLNKQEIVSIELPSLIGTPCRTIEDHVAIIAKIRKNGTFL